MAEPLKSQIEAQDRLDQEEHWRLLYVGMTRAEERLYVGGALGAADRGTPAEASWYGAIDASMTGLGSEWEEDPVWGRSRRFGELERPARAATLATEQRRADSPPAPGACAIEARPPRPLAPSASAEDDVPNPPPSPELRAAAERGRLLHQLFERLPGVPIEQRAKRADLWLHKSAGIEEEALRQALVADACAIIGRSSSFGNLRAGCAGGGAHSGRDADGSVITGTVDRLLVSEDLVRLLDFKTGRSFPRTAADIPAAHLRQMAAYQAALEVIFPDRVVEASLLYTTGPLLYALPREMLLQHMPQSILATA
jgi:ATP-dependent helicase/nuclease subunit A